MPMLVSHYKIAEDKIVGYLQQQTCCTICCIDSEGRPYCFNCYFSFHPEEGILCFKSAASSFHAVLLQNNPNVAGTVLPDKLNKLNTKGVQFQGVLLDPQHPLAEGATSKYHHRHPLALGFRGDVFTIQLNHIKMTDSSIGFGKKTNWDREN